MLISVPIKLDSISPVGVKVHSIIPSFPTNALETETPSPLNSPIMVLLVPINPGALFVIS